MAVSLFHQFNPEKRIGRFESLIQARPASLEAARSIRFVA
jgi:hypothetical protein